MIERVTQPTNTTCWHACVSMLTGIDLELLPLWLEGPSAVGFADGTTFGTRVFVKTSRFILKEDDVLATWKELLLSLGYRLAVDAPSKPYMMPMVYVHGPNDITAHIVVVDEDENIVDPAWHDVLNGQRAEVIEEWCNIIRPVVGRRLSLEPVTES